MIPIEELAKELHEAGRAAVEQGNTVAAGTFGEKSRTFLEWDEITAEAQDGRRMQARYLLDKFNIAPKTDGPITTFIGELTPEAREELMQSLLSETGPIMVAQTFQPAVCYRSLADAEEAENREDGSE